MWRGLGEFQDFFTVRSTIYLNLVHVIAPPRLSMVNHMQIPWR